MVRKLSAALALACLLAAGATTPTFAANKDENDESTAMLSSKVTLSQAITAAEQKTGGKAFDAGVDVESGKTQIIVETNGPKGVQTVILDAQSGQPVSVEAGGRSD